MQVSKIRNVSAPKSNEESHAAPRMLKITLTDGHASCHAVEVAKLEKISLTTPPGTKVRLRPGQKIPVRGGFLQLGPGQVWSLQSCLISTSVQLRIWDESLQCFIDKFAKT